MDWMMRILLTMCGMSVGVGIIKLCTNYTVFQPVGNQNLNIRDIKCAFSLMIVSFSVYFKPSRSLPNFFVSLSLSSFTIICSGDITIDCLVLISCFWDNGLDVMHFSCLSRLTSNARAMLLLQHDKMLLFAAIRI